MDSFINILRGASTPKEGVSSEETYDNGVGFLNPLVWQTEYPEEYEGAATFPSIDLAPAATQAEPVVQTSSDDDASSSLKKAISDITGGKIKVHSTISNPATLENIYNVLTAIKDYAGGELSPNHTLVIDDMDKDKTTPYGHSDAAGLFTHQISNGRSPAWNSPDKVRLRWTDNPDYAEWVANDQSMSGYWSTGSGESTAAHELGHAAQTAVDKIISREGPQGLLDRLRLLKDSLSPESNRDNLYRKAAEASGFTDDVEGAASSVSQYATDSPEEMFAEAFADVVLNKDDAAPFSKQLVNTYVEEAKNWRGKIRDYNRNPFEREAREADIINILRNR